MAEQIYRPAKPIQWTVRDTSTVLFDDELYVPAIDFLSSLLHAGGSDARSGAVKSQSHAYVPYPQQLALLSTIVIHPLFTNRSSSDERSAASNLALRLLNDITRIVGPVAADFETAFTPSSRRPSRRDTKRRTADTDSSDGDAEKKLENKYAQTESVWAQVEDFWHILGWALNCSIREPKRWERWKLWLEWLVDALEADWAERVKRSRALLEGDEAAARDTLLKSVICRYVREMQGRNGRRRMMRAIFANGDQNSMNEFPEVWENETKERKRKGEDFDTRPRKKLNLDEDDFGDYDAEEDEDEVMESPSQEDGDITLLAHGQKDEGTDLSRIKDPFQIGTVELGGLDAVNLRHRIMALLYQVALDLPNDFTHIEDLFDIYTEFIRPLPLSQFSIMESNPYLHAQARLALAVNHLLPLQSTSVRLKGGRIFKMGQDDLVRDFLHKPANAFTTIDNAKVSLALEASLMALMEEPGIKADDKFGASLEEGIRARKKRAIADGRKKGKGLVGEENDAREELELSSQRLMMLLEVAEAAEGIVRNRTQAIALDDQTSSLSGLSDLSDDDV